MGVCQPLPRHLGPANPTPERCLSPAHEPVRNFFPPALGHNGEGIGARGEVTHRFVQRQGLAEGLSGAGVLKCNTVAGCDVRFGANRGAFWFRWLNLRKRQGFTGGRRKHRPVFQPLGGLHGGCEGGGNQTRVLLICSFRVQNPPNLSTARCSGKTSGDRPQILDGASRQS